VLAPNVHAVADTDRTQQDVGVQPCARIPIVSIELEMLRVNSLKSSSAASAAVSAIANSALC